MRLRLERQKDLLLAHNAQALIAEMNIAGIELDLPRERIEHVVPQSRRGKISGQVPLADGKLSLDPRDVRSASATITVDLSKLSIDSAPPTGEELSGTPDALAQQWLELGPGVAEERRAQFANARFELASLDNLSTTFLELGATRKPSALRATAVGTLLLHGFRAPLRAEVRVTPTGADRLSIHSVGALVIALAPHDIAPRGPAGVVDALGAARAADWVGKVVRVEFELVASASK